MASGSKLNNRGYALITGASTGLGRSIARELAGMGYDIILVALEDEHLPNTEEEIRSTFGVEVCSIAADMSNADAADIIFQFVELKDLPVNILVNNVGMGFVSNFEKMPLEFYEKLMNLNAMTMMRLTYLLIPRLLTSGDSHVLSIGSIASLFPAPFKAMYSASKHFVRSLSLSLREEFKGRINFTVSYPAGIITSEVIRKRAETFGWMAKKGMMEPGDVARVSLKAMFRKERYVNPGTVVYYQVARYILGYENSMKIMVRNFRKQLKDNGGQGM